MMGDYLKRIVARSAAARAPALLGPLPRLAPAADDATPREGSASEAPHARRPTVPAAPWARSAVEDAHGVAPHTPSPAPSAATPVERAQRALAEPHAETAPPDPAPERSTAAGEPPASRVVLAPSTEPDAAADPLETMDREIRRLLSAAQRQDSEPLETPSAREPGETRSIPHAEPRSGLPRLEPLAPREPAPPRAEAKRLVIGRVLVEVVPPAPAAPPAAPPARTPPAPQPFRAGELRGVAFRRSFGLGQS